MLPELPSDLKVAKAMGISFFAGECEGGRLDEVLLDGWNGKLKSIYNYMDKLPTLTGEPTPFLPLKHVKRDRCRLQHGSRPRLSLPMLVPHDHQCAGTQEPQPDSG